MNVEQQKALALARARRRRAEAGPSIDQPTSNNIQQPDTTPTEDALGYVNRAVQSAAGGITGGFADEIAATLDAPFVAGYRAVVDGQPFDMEKAREDRLNAYRQDLKKFRTEYPGSALTTEIAGAVVSPMTKAAMPYAMGARGANLFAKMGRGFVTGAGLGGIYGAGNSEGDLRDRAAAAASGAAVGGVLGGIAPPLVAGVGKGVGYLADQTVNRLPSRQVSAAAVKVSEALQRDGLSLDDAAARIKELGPEAALMDVGPNTRALMAQAYQKPGEAKKIIGDKLTVRQEGQRGPYKALEGGQANRIGGMIDELVPGDYHATKEGIAAANKSSDFYTRAYEANQNVDSKEINRILKTPAGETALQNAVQMMQNDMTLVAKPTPEMSAAWKEAIDLGMVQGKGGVVIKPPALTGFGVAKGLKLRTLDYIKRALGDMEQSAAKTGARDKARIIGGMRKSLTRELDKADVTATKGKPGDYSQARKFASDKFRSQDALESGSKFMLKSEFTDPRALELSIKKMSPEERHMFRLGAAQALKSKLGDLVVRADATKKMMDIPALEKKIMTAFGNKDVFKQYITRLEGEKEMFASYAAAKGNSATAERLAAMADAGKETGRIMQGVRQIANPNPINWVRGGVNVLGGIKDRALTTKPMSKNLADILIGNVPPDMAPQYAKAANLAKMRNDISAFLLKGGASQGGSNAGR